MTIAQALLNSLRVLSAFCKYERVPGLGYAFDDIFDDLVRSGPIVHKPAINVANTWPLGRLYNIQGRSIPQFSDNHLLRKLLL